MTVAASSHPTMPDYQNRVDADGTISDIIEIIRETNRLVDYIPWIECNDGDGHETTVRTGLPVPTWRKLYGGVQPTKSETRKVRDTTGIMHAYAEVDVDLVEKNGNSAAWRMSEETAFIDGMNEEFMETFFYGNETGPSGSARTASAEPEAFTGLVARYNDTSAENGRHVIKDGTTPNTSFWVLTFGPRSLHGIYPKGFTMGLRSDDKGQVTIEDTTGSGGGRMEAYRTHYRWACGISLRDWRTCARVQVDLSEAGSSSSPTVNLFDNLSKALARTQRGGSGARRVIVANEDTIERFRLQAKHAVSSSTLTRQELAGRDVDMIDGVPVLLCDALAYDEAEAA